jgi:hypothetical protein
MHVILSIYLNYRNLIYLCNFNKIYNIYIYIYIYNYSTDSNSGKIYVIDETLDDKDKIKHIINIH